MRAAESAAAATWTAVYVAGLSLLIAVLTAYFAYRSIQGWRAQALGQHEFGRLIDALQGLHDVEAIIVNHRLPVIFGEGNKEEKSLTFRTELQRAWSHVLRATVGLEEVWDGEFKILKDAVDQKNREVALASRYVFEEGNGTPRHEQLVGAPPTTRGADFEEHMQLMSAAGDELIKPIHDLREWLTTRLRNYVK